MMRRVEEAVVRRLRGAGGVDVRTGATTDLLISVADGQPVGADLKIRHRFSESTFDEFEAAADTSRRQVILVVPSLAPKRRTEARRRHLSWIEYETGVVHVRLAGLAIDLPEETPEATAVASARLPSLAGKAGIVVEAVLELALSSEYVEQAEVAELAGSTRAWTSKVFSALINADAMEVTGRGPRKRWRPHPRPLLELWVRDGGPSARATGLYVSARSPEQLLERLAATSAVRGRYAVGGAAAADLYEPTLTSRPKTTVWIPAAVPAEHLADELGGGEVVDSGANVVAWQAHGDPALRLSRQLASWRGTTEGGLGRLFLVSPARAVVESIHAAGRAEDVGENLRHVLLERFERLHGETH